MSHLTTTLGLKQPCQSSRDLLDYLFRNYMTIGYSETKVKHIGFAKKALVLANRPVYMSVPISTFSELAR